MADQPSPHLTPSWRRKTEEDRRRDLALEFSGRSNPLPSVRVGLAGAAVGLVVGLSALRKDVSSVRFVLAFSLVLAVVFGGLCFVLAYGLQVMGWASMPKRLRMGICTRCFKLTLDGTLDHCSCGGTFEDADGWTLNRCPRCNYDLRGSPDRCPECGSELRFGTSAGASPSGRLPG